VSRRSHVSYGIEFGCLAVYNAVLAVAKALSESPAHTLFLSRVQRPSGEVAASRASFTAAITPMTRDGAANPATHSIAIS
jgi:hypothetical protein